MAETGTVTAQRVLSDDRGKRIRELTVTFSGAGTLTITKAALGLLKVDELLVKAPAVSAAAINLTTNTDGSIDSPSTGTTVVTAGGAVTGVVLRFVGR